MEFRQSYDAGWVNVVIDSRDPIKRELHFLNVHKSFFLPNKTLYYTLFSYASICHASSPFFTQAQLSSFLNLVKQLSIHCANAQTSLQSSRPFPRLHSGWKGNNGGYAQTRNNSLMEIPMLRIFFIQHYWIQKIQIEQNISQSYSRAN